MADQQSNTAAGALGRLGPPPRKALGSSAIAAEQAYRTRSGLPLLTEEDITALKAGEPMPWECGEGAPVASAPAAAAAPAAPAAASCARGCGAGFSGSGERRGRGHDGRRTQVEPVFDRGRASAP